MSSRPNLQAPANYVARGDWKLGEVEGPRLVLYAQAFAAAVDAAIGERTLRDVARQADLSHTTLLAVLRGQRWPDMVTIAKLEEAFARDLWPGPAVRRSRSG